MGVAALHEGKHCKRGHPSTLTQIAFPSPSISPLFPLHPVPLIFLSPPTSLSYYFSPPITLLSFISFYSPFPPSLSYYPSPLLLSFHLFPSSSTFSTLILHFSPSPLSFSSFIFSPLLFHLPPLLLFPFSHHFSFLSTSLPSPISSPSFSCSPLPSLTSPLPSTSFRYFSSHFFPLFSSFCFPLNLLPLLLVPSLPSRPSSPLSPLHLFSPP